MGIVNSAVFHGGFLTGGQLFDYQEISPDSEKGKLIYDWRRGFQDICARYRVQPADACLHFGMSHPAIASMALNTSKPEKMNRNVEILQRSIPEEFWRALKEGGLIATGYPYLGA